MNHIADLQEEERPREKMQRHGARTLTDAELLALLLASGTTERSVLDLARALLAQANNDLSLLSHFTLEELKREKGIGDAKAITLLAAFELGRRRTEKARKERVFFRNTDDLFKYVQPILEGLPYEELWVFFLNRANRLVAHHKHSQGVSHAVLIDDRQIVREALELRADAVALAHNHPSEVCNPSIGDIEATKRLKKGLDFFGMRLLDHLVIAGENYYAIQKSELREFSL